MKMLTLGFAVALLAAAVAVFPQGKFVVKNPDFPTYHYQVFDVKEPVPPAGVVQLPNASTGLNSRTSAQGSPASSPPPSSAFTRVNRNLEILCSELGSKGYRLVHLFPRPGGSQAVFEKETLPVPKK